MKTVLIYVLGANMDPYPDLMRASLDTWDQPAVEGTETVFYTTPLKNPLPKTAVFNMPDGLYEMGRKNLAAFKWALENKQWDYMARVNASCYVRKAKLLEHVQTLPDANLFQGIGVKDSDWMWGGGQYVLSRDVVRAIVDNGHRWDHGNMEDVSMSRLVKSIGIPFNGNGRVCSINKNPKGGWLCFAYGQPPSFEFKEIAEMKRADPQYFIRVKQDLMRWQDVWLMKELYRAGIC